ncbi:MAG: diguanylate cyclase [Gammaproteobacteria bacterium]|nr:diguanylate cyclase [Gammaproteobacteria bacterium]
MAVGENLSVDPGLMRALVRHLEHLQRHPDGGELLQLIKDALHHCRVRGLVNGSCLSHLHQQLLAYTRNNALPSSIRLRARLIQQHLAIYLPQPDHVIPARAAAPAPKVATPAKTAPESRALKAPDSQLTETPAMESPRTPEPQPALAATTPEAPRAAKAGAPQHLDELRQMLAKGMDEMLHEREALARQLSDATAYLKMIEAEREQLHEELNKARRRIRAGEKSTKRALGLPKRDVLVRQIESEVERVKRHGEPLALALIDIDNLENIQQQHGPEIADAVLNRYTSEVLGRFRSYDMVARYNKNEFAVLLPNTGKDNALRALEKVHKRAKESHFSHKGRSYPLPGFGGVLTFYSPGEEPHQMLRRADEALVNLKLRGERQLVVV